MRWYQRFALHPSGETPIATALSLIYVTDNTTREEGNMTVIRSLVRAEPALWGCVTALTLWVAVISNAWGGPIDDIVKRGGVKIGVLSGVPLYGTVDAKGEPAGYDIDVANVLAGYLGVKAELVPLVPPARIPALQAGKIDFLVATLAITPERAKVVSFTKPYSAFQMVIFSTKVSPLSKLLDLTGKRVSVNRGGSQDTALVRANIPGLEVVRFQDDATAVQAMITHQVDAAAVADSVATDVIKQQPAAELAIKFVFFNQFNAMAVRLEDAEIRDWLNKAIDKMVQSGELNKIALRWTAKPLPALAP